MMLDDDGDDDGDCDGDGDALRDSDGDDDDVSWKGTLDADTVAEFFGAVDILDWEDDGGTDFMTLKFVDATDACAVRARRSAQIVSCEGTCIHCEISP